ncbi:MULTISPECIES: sigma-70 family RNA polymerase sigma factor [Pseudomonas]|jgi:RNA polymerase sigma-70 factor (ECF subfamily)|uniref:RNA polymerase sigma-70 factor, ECF subfamily n=1 Tax=Pseudomonas psychrophila TaxID=122355 RepID=A0ABY0VVT2_9PSED|nr:MULTISPECIES: sigma-70 family RNA polymerase sigma factor [Pseudomonas]EPJ93340.1 ECF subfamily RNA polymerase sigma factor [Pseudomonas psychrophila]KAB0492103.1 sigma-70 family RNA polymerase sigma factor [Pseudomonas psychrophila]KMM99290.1 RNA polymerase sigma factor [Pseudomonas psychrophila]KOX63035.1 RNA polymerase subunit sigma [Pseudomonas psychrophila]MDY7580270.1 sigma-70 family RNA polymerase sigma factor [Pseudomonas sp. CCI3.1]
MIEAATPKEQTLHALYRDHRSWLENWLRQRMGNAWDAADLSQDTFVRVLASAQPLADLREPRAYLLTVGKRLLSNFYTRRSLEQAYLDALAQLPEDSVPSPEQRWLLLETLQALDELLDGLPAVVRRAFLWSQLEGLGYREIAERLKVSERTVKRYMAQAYEHCLLVDA